MPLHRRAALLVALVPLLASVACASRLPEPRAGALGGIVDLYSRNGWVCGPTAVGNAIGATAGLAPYTVLALVTSPAAWVADDIDGPLHRPLRRILVQPPAYLGGAVTGTPFLPLAWLGGSDPCAYPGIDRWFD